MATTELTLGWIGHGAPRMEIVRVAPRGRDLVADGTQLGALYELHYHLEASVLELEVVGQRSLQVELGEADFFDLGYSPLFNSLPVIRDGLLVPGSPRNYTMRWVDVPSLEVDSSEQQYKPLGNGLLRFRSGSFTADIQFDKDGFVLDYPDLARRI